jgi:hypothetical protein
MAKFAYDDIVKIIDGAASELRPGSKAWVVGVFEEKDRQGQYFEIFPEGVVYTIEFEDGKSTEIHEADLVLFEE